MTTISVGDIVTYGGVQWQVARVLHSVMGWPAALDLTRTDADGVTHGLSARPSDVTLAASQLPMLDDGEG